MKKILSVLLLCLLADELISSVHLITCTKSWSEADRLG